MSYFQAVSRRLPRRNEGSLRSISITCLCAVSTGCRSLAAAAVSESNVMCCVVSLYRAARALVCGTEQGPCSEACATSRVYKNCLLVRFLLCSPALRRQCAGNKQLMLIESCARCMSASSRFAKHNIHSVMGMEYWHSLLRNNGPEVGEA